MRLPEGGAWILIDKPAGKTSFDVVAIVRRIIGEKKVGHAGTLDPMATGLLVIGYGKATKLLTDGLAGGKTYEATAKFGLVSPSHDTDTVQLQEVTVPKFDRVRVEAALQEIASRAKQTPPLVSAIKLQGSVEILYRCSIVCPFNPGVLRTKFEFSDIRLFFDKIDRFIQIAHGNAV